MILWEDLEAPAMSMMADLAASEGLGYGQALTASEMAINAGSKTCLLVGKTAASDCLSAG